MLFNRKFFQSPFTFHTIFYLKIPEYTTDEVIDVQCTSRRSYPAAKIDFFINDEPVSVSLINRNKFT